MKSKAMPSWTASSLVMKRGVATTNRNRSDSQWNGVTRILHQHKKFRSHRSAGRVMCTVLWNAQGIILLDFLEPGLTVNSERYIKTLIKLRA